MAETPTLSQGIGSHPHLDPTTEKRSAEPKRLISPPPLTFSSTEIAPTSLLLLVEGTWALDQNQARSCTFILVLESPRHKLKPVPRSLRLR